MAIKPSLRLAILLVLSHALAASVVSATMIPMVARLALLMTILLSLLYYLARDAMLLLSDSWCKVSFGQCSVSVVTRDGSGFFGQFSSKSTVSPYFAVLHVRCEGHRLPVLRTIFPDALEAGEFRELCVLLKFTQ